MKKSTENQRSKAKKVQCRNIVPAELNKDEKLLFFGIDYLVLNLIHKNDCDYEESSKLFRLFNTFFDLPHNTSNADTYNHLNWCDYDVELAFKDYRKGKAIEIRMSGKHIITFIKIDPDSGMAKMSPYLYRVEFRGQFFNMERIKKLKSRQFLKDFFYDYEKNLISFKASRIDICADLAGYLPDHIEEGFHTNLDISISKYKIKKAGVETIYFGALSGRKKIRAYNKKIEAEIHSKKGDYLDYFQYEIVTRLEVELRSESCKKFKIKLSDLFDRNKLFSIYSQALNTKDIEFEIVDFIERELKKIGINKMDIELENIDKYSLLPFCKYAKRFLRQAEKIRDTYKINPLMVLLEDEEFVDKSEMDIEELYNYVLLELCEF